MKSLSVSFIRFCTLCDDGELKSVEEQLDRFVTNMDAWDAR